MIPVLYPSTAITYTSNGIGRLVEAVSCIVTEDLNGIFELEMEYPVNGKYFSQMQSGGIIGVIYNGKMQPFDINKLTIDTTGIATINASHISNRLAFDWVVGQQTARTLSQIISNMNGSGQWPYTQNFTFATDVSSSATMYVELYENAKSLLARCAATFGGEIEYDVFTVTLKTRRGTDTGLKVAYGKNASELERETDWSGAWNAIIPYWYEGEGGAGYWPYSTLDAFQTVTQTPVIPKRVNFKDIFPNKPTQQQLYNAGVNYLNAYTPWIPKDTVESAVLEVSDNDPMRDVRIGDTLTVIFTQAGTAIENARVVSVEYNVLLERNNTITVGSEQENFVAVTGLDDEPQRFLTPGDIATESDTPTASDGTLVAGSTIKKSGHVCVLDYGATGVDVPTTLTTIGTIPSKYAPSETTQGIAIIGFGTGVCYADVTTGGNIRIRGASAVSSAAVRMKIAWIQ